MKIKSKITFLLLMIFILPMFTGNMFAAGAIKGYFRDRFFDLCDLFRFQIKIPRKEYCFNINARCTVLAQVGAGYFQGYNFGFDRRGAGLWREKKAEGGLSFLYFSSIENQMAFGNSFTDDQSDWSKFAPRGIVRNLPHWDDGRYNPLSIGFEAQFFFLPGINIGFYPEELFDFVTGIFGIDLKDDDLKVVQKVIERQAPEEEPEDSDLIPVSESESEEETETKIIEPKANLDIQKSIKPEDKKIDEVKEEKKAQPSPEIQKPAQQQVTPAMLSKKAEDEAKKESDKKVTDKTGLVPPTLSEDEVKTLEKKEEQKPENFGPPSPPAAPTEK